jgi:hypothetical protein
LTRAHAVSVFATASARLFAEITHDDPQPWKQQLASAASQWMAHRASSN